MRETRGHVTIMGKAPINFWFSAAQHQLDSMAAHISRAFLLSTGSSSTPFLYQTRTLAPLSRSLCHPFTRLQRQYSANNVPENDDGHKPGSANEHDASSETPSEATPSLAPNDRPAPRRSFLRRRAESATPNPEPKKPATPSRPLQTITHAEKMIFADLIGQLKHEKPAPTPLKQKQSQASSRRPKPNNVNDLIAMFDSLLDKKEKEKEKKKKPEKSGATTRGDSRKDFSGISGGSEKILLSDLGFLELGSGSGENFEITLSDAVDMVVQRESAKIEHELFGAIEEGRGDMGLWEECQEHIFGMLQHLEEPTLADVDAGSANNSTPSTTGGSEDLKPSSGPLNIPALVPVTPVLAKLYPNTLLVAFRLLNTHFPESQLIGQFRSLIKTQGRTSSVLGTSAALCDEMIYFYWHGCNDLPAVISFLHDMDLHGIAPSSKSRRLLKDIVRQRFRDLDPLRNSNTGMDSFWNLPPNQKAFRDLAGPGGWLDRLDEQARRRSPVPFTRV